MQGQRNKQKTSTSPLETCCPHLFRASEATKHEPQPHEHSPEASLVGHVNGSANDESFAIWQCPPEAHQLDRLRQTPEPFLHLLDFGGETNPPKKVKGYPLTGFVEVCR